MQVNNSGDPNNLDRWLAATRKLNDLMLCIPWKNQIPFDVTMAAMIEYLAEPTVDKSDFLKPLIECFESVYKPDLSGPRPPVKWAEAKFAMALGFAVYRDSWFPDGNTPPLIYRVPANEYPAQTIAAKQIYGDGALVHYKAYYAKSTTEGVEFWLPTDDDMAEDWRLDTEI